MPTREKKRDGLGVGVRGSDVLLLFQPLHEIVKERWVNCWESGTVERMHIQDEFGSDNVVWESLSRARPSRCIAWTRYDNKTYTHVRPSPWDRASRFERTQASCSTCPGKLPCRSPDTGAYFLFGEGAGLGLLAVWRVGRGFTEGAIFILKKTRARVCGVDMEME